MIKINLLPKSIYERKIVKNTAILFGVLMAAVIAVGILYAQLYWVPRVADMEAQAAHAEDLKKQVEDLEGQTKGWNDLTAPIQTKLSFIQAVLDYNLKYPQLYEDIAKWTYEKVSYTGLNCDGAVVSMSARVKSLDDLGRFLLNMYHATDLFTEVTISGVPGYPMADGGGMLQAQNFTGTGPQANLAGMSAVQQGVVSGPGANYINFTVTCKLRTPIVRPSFAGSSSATPDAQGAPGSPVPQPMPAPDQAPVPQPGPSGNSQGGVEPPP